MCGIAGWISDKSIAIPDLDIALLLFSEERGGQSAGMFRANKGLLKRNISASRLVQDKRFDKLVSKPTTVSLIHTRYPTSGGRGPRQAQPFARGNYVTVHNGWYSNCAELKEKFSLKKFTGVDSELACAFAYEYGVRSLPRFLESSEGPSAIAAYDGKALHLVSYGNPIAYAFVMYKGVNLLVFASTRKILENALELSGLTGTAYSLEENTLFSVTPWALTEVAKLKTKIYFQVEVTHDRKTRKDKKSLDLIEFDTLYEYASQQWGEEDESISELDFKDKTFFVN